MALQVRPSIRLFVDQPLAAGGTLVLVEGQAHYLAQVMRRKESDRIALFNGTDGEWAATVRAVLKKSVTVIVEERVLTQRASPDVWLVFAPIKGKVEFVIEKAVELGVSAVVPVFSQRAIVSSVNEGKLKLVATEAAEQCGRLDVPVLAPKKDISALLGSWPKDRVLLHADESGGGAPLKDVLAGLSGHAGGLAVLVGPEGGFTPEERAMLAAHPQVKGFGMGARILRADTASVAALACVQAWLGDWHQIPHFQEEA